MYKLPENARIFIDSGTRVTSLNEIILFQERSNSCYAQLSELPAMACGSPVNRT